MAYYHGTTKKNVKVLRPRQPRHKSEPKAVYFSKEVYGPEIYALVKGGGKNIGINYITGNHSRRFEGGVVVSKGPFNLAKKGYVYKAAETKSIVKNPKASNNEYISKDPVRAAFYKEVSRQGVLDRGWKTFENQRFPNVRASWEIAKIARASR